MLYEKYLNTVDQKASELCRLSDAIWEIAETAFGEFKSSALLADKLEAEGFCVERGIVGIPTAFKATFGHGKPHFGILAEYDGLEGLSQEGGIAEKRPIPGKNTCHGCGHNLFGAGSLGAALAVKSYIAETGKGSVTLFGCPAEEGGSGKVFMARDGVFSDVDAVVSWHPEKMYMVRTRPSLANVMVNYTFEGVAAHAGGSPHLGRSALDAVELMNVGTNFLREHMELTSRVHYAILDAGGNAPNMVQSHAVVQYLIRAVDGESVKELHARVERIAQGAALMTDTTYTSRRVSAYSNLITIPTLQRIANEAMHDVPLPIPTEEDVAYGKALQATMNLTSVDAAKPMYADKVLDPAPPVAHGGSTDTADVSWNCPTVQMHIGNWVVGTPGHSWQSTSQSRSDYAKRAMLYASKAVAGTILRLMNDPSAMEQIKKEHAERVGAGYVCPLPDGLEPNLKPMP